MQKWFVRSEYTHRGNPTDQTAWLFRLEKDLQWLESSTFNNHAHSMNILIGRISLLKFVRQSRLYIILPLENTSSVVIALLIELKMPIMHHPQKTGFPSATAIRPNN